MADSTDHLGGAAHAFVAAARRATLATIAPTRRARLVPVCFVVIDPIDGAGARIYSPLDDKPKRVRNPSRLARVRDIAERPAVTLLVERWDEDWSRLAWIRIDGDADLLAPDAGTEHLAAVAALREKYPQYQGHDLDGRPLIRIVVERVTWWGDIHVR